MSMPFYNSWYPKYETMIFIDADSIILSDLSGVVESCKAVPFLARCKSVIQPDNPRNADIVVWMKAKEAIAVFGIKNPIYEYEAQIISVSSEDQVALNIRSEAIRVQDFIYRYPDKFPSLQRWARNTVTEELCLSIAGALVGYTPDPFPFTPVWHQAD